ncbi:MAG: minor capsid protein [Coriobacteriia bacterium]|nr:minor capsid protein [Coriobacteriia bacterium]
MQISAKVTNVDLSRAIAKAGLLKRGVRMVVTLAAREDAKQFVPFEAGALRDSAETESRPEDGLIIWGNASVPYARRQYYALPGKRWPGTTCYWFDAARAAYLSRWIQIAQREGDRIAGS